MVGWGVTLRQEIEELLEQATKVAPLLAPDLLSETGEPDFVTALRYHELWLERLEVLERAILRVASRVDEVVEH